MLTRLLATAAALAVFAPASTALAAGTSTGADIQVSGSSNLGSPVQGQPYVYTYQVKNSGPQDATSVTFTDDLTAGRLVYAQVQAPTFATNCSQTSDGAGGTSISCPISLAKGQQVNVVESVNAPSTIGSFANTGTATAADVADPQPANNSSTVTVKVGSAACPLPAGQTTITGFVTGRQTDSFGIVNRITIDGTDGVQYTALLNFDGDPNTPPTTAINLLCKVVPPNLYIQAFVTDNVTGTVDMEVLPGATVATPVIHASVVQVPYWTDKVA